MDSHAAAAAGVAVQTLYLAIGSKALILSAVLDEAVVGDDEPVPLLDRPWVKALDELDGPAAVRLLAHEGSRVVARTAPVYRRMQEAAADLDVAPLLERARAQRYEVMRRLARTLSRKDGFAPQLPAPRAADLFYSLISDGSFRLLCIDRGWPHKQWESWLADTLANTCFPRR